MEIELGRDNIIDFKGIMTSAYCSKCRVRTRIDYKHMTQNNDDTYFAITVCIDCNNVTILQYKTKETITRPRRKPNCEIVELIYSYPCSSELQTEDLPENIIKSYIEGVNCLNANAPNGSVVMFRRTLQQICVKLGANPTDDLVEQIKKLPKEIDDAATEIRKWGNLASHEDNRGIIPSISNEDAESIKRFLERIFLIVYKHPGEIERSKNKRSGFNQFQ